MKVMRALMMLLVFFALAACRYVGSGDWPAPSITIAPAPSELPPDVHALGEVRLANHDDRSSAISSDAAVEAANARGYDWPNPETYLVVITRGVTSSSIAPIANRLCWILRWDELSISFGGPYTSGDDVTPEPYDHAYVIVDALTGEVLGATYTGPPLR